MSQAYIRERRTDALVLIVPFVVTLTAFGSFFIVALNSFEEPVRWMSLWACIIFSPLSAYFSHRSLKSDRQLEASMIFLVTHLLLLTLVTVELWGVQYTGALPYSFGVLVVVSSMIVNLRAGFFVWAISALLLMGGLALAGELDLRAFVILLPSTFLNLLLAIASFLSAYDWEIALESVSLLQWRAQTRRDELFTMQEELTMSNAKLRHLNEALELARSQAIDERDLRTRFMNTVSHELRTPLNAIVNFANILARGGIGEVNKHQIDYLARVEKAGWHLLEVLNDLLDMAAIESGEFKLHQELVLLDELCEEAMTNMRGLIVNQDIQLIRDYPVKWPYVYVDPIRIKQALINLLGNAAKYTEQGHIALRIKVETKQLFITVEDTGIGIAPEHQELIFREFQQVDEAPARRRAGTGLGLPITRHLIERHGGAIQVESEVGKGSRFMITLPLPDQALIATYMDTGSLPVQHG